MTKLTVSLILFSALFARRLSGRVPKLNAAEQRMHDEVAAAFVAAVLQPPESWKISAGEPKPLSPALCSGDPPGTMSVSASMLFRYLNPPAPPRPGRRRRSSGWRTR